MVVSRKLYEHSCPHCSTTAHPVAEATLPPEFLKLLSSQTLNLIESAFNKKQYSGVLSIIGKLLTTQVHDNYRTITLDWKTPDIEMLHRLTRDVWSFSAAKDYQQMRDLTLALRDDTGKLREFGAFKEAAMKVCNKYNETWLQTEYNQAVAASQNAARWTQFTADKADIPFIEYQTIGDDAVRASHVLLDGIVRKVDDLFWSTHYPPNGWGCRCEAIQAVGAKSPKKDIPNVVIPEMFRTNLAQTGIIYPKNHPYYDKIPKAEITKAIAYLPPENTFVSYNIGNNKVIDIHPLHGKNELEKNVDACKIIKDIEKKADIKLMPIIEVNAKTKTKDIATRKVFYGDKYIKTNPETCPDILFNGKIAEIETATNTASSIKNRVRDGKLQADFILIHVPDTMSLDDAYRHANGQMNWYKDKEDLTVWVFNSSGKRELTTKKKR